MAEGQVTVDNVIRQLPKPFMVIATQNPASFAGTYPLPEAQLDRFMMRLSIGYPDESAELQMARNHIAKISDTDAAAIVSSDDIASMTSDTESVHLSDALLAYMQQITDRTRIDPAFTLGASPRALLHLVAIVRARAYIQGRDYATPDDVKYMAVPVLSHRLVLTTEMRLQKKSVSDLLNALILKIPVPME